MLPPVQIMVLLHFRVYVILKGPLQELEGPRRLLPPFEGEHLEWTQTSQPTPISPRASPWVQAYLVENIQFTQRAPL